MQLLDRYSIEEVGGEARVLKRPNGYMLAAFGRGVKFENIQQVAEADHRYLRAKKLDSMFDVGGTQRVPTCSQRTLGQPDRSTS